MSGDAGIKVSRRRGYTLIYNDLLPDDGSLSARAWGIYVYLAGRPDGWETRAGHLSKVFKEGRDAIYTALRELVDAGLMAKEPYDDKGLRRIRYVLDVDEARPGPAFPDTDSQDPGNPDAGTPDTEEPDAENPGGVTTDGTSTEVASTDGPTTEQPPPAAVAAEPDVPTEAEIETAHDADGNLLTGHRMEQVTNIITQAWWDWAAAQNALPTQGFPAIRGIVRTALRNGVPPKRVKSGLARLTQDGRPVTGPSLQMAMRGDGPAQAKRDDALAESHAAMFEGAKP